MTAAPHETPLTDFLPAEQEALFADPARARANLTSLQKTTPVHTLSHVLRAACGSFDPDRALDHFEQFFQKWANTDDITEIDWSATFLAQLAGAFSGSQYLTNLLLKDATLAVRLREPAFLQKPKSAAVLTDALRSLVFGEATYAGRLVALRRFRHAEYLRIGLRDLLGHAPITGILAEISDLADAALQVGLEICTAEVRLRYGTPEDHLPDGSRRPARFSIIGLGKLGGRELNFSSDIDIYYIYSSSQGATTVAGADHSDAQSVTNHVYFRHLSQLLTAAIGELTDDGRVFRVDLRLRPEGAQGEICHSLRSCEVYYESWGENWERQVLIKARHCAGDASLSAEFVTLVTPFVYRKFLDYDTITDIRTIKERIDQTLAVDGHAEHHLKLGYGGIREIEFIVQSFQMISGGRDPELRSRETLAVLETLQQKKILDPTEAAGLADAYRFLRAAENRIQLANDLQRYHLPDTLRELRILARQMGYQGDNPDDTLMARYHEHQAAVRRVYDNLFYAETEAPEETLVFIDDNREVLLAHFTDIGFTDAERAYRLFHTLRNGDRSDRPTKRSRHLLDRLAPHLVAAMAASPDPDLSLVNFMHFAEATGAREQLFEMLSGKPNLAELLLRLFGSSRFLAQRLIGYPGEIDRLLNVRIWQKRLDADGYLAALREETTDTDTLEAKMDALRKFKSAAELHIAMRGLSHTSDFDALCTDLSALADACLEIGIAWTHAALRPAWGIPGFRDAHGRQQRVDLVIFGAGKLGGRELDFGSDLDLVMVYGKEGVTYDDGDGPAPPRTGKTNFEYYTAFYKVFRTLLSDVTTAGPGYSLDLRLRPEGKSGPFICPLDLFGRYFYHRAALWERQMLTKIRRCAGDPILAAQVLNVIRTFLHGAGLLPDQIREIAAMRQRLEEELAQETGAQKDLKRGYGGVVDIEFIAQMLQLAHGRGTPSLWCTGTLQTLAAARDRRFLDADDAAALTASYRFLRRIEHTLRIVDNRSVHQFSTTPEGLARIARRLDYQDGDQSAGAQLAAAYDRHTRQVREIYDRVFAEELRNSEAAFPVEPAAEVITPPKIQS